MSLLFRFLRILVACRGLDHDNISTLRILFKRLAWPRVTTQHHPEAFLVCNRVAQVSTDSACSSPLLVVYCESLDCELVNRQGFAKSGLVKFQGKPRIGVH